VVPASAYLAIAYAAAYLNAKGLLTKKRWFIRTLVCWLIFLALGTVIFFVLVGICENFD